MAEDEDHGRAEDFFLELANKPGENVDTNMIRNERHSSRAYHNKHHSVPNFDVPSSSPIEERPRSSGRFFAAETSELAMDDTTLRRFARRTHRLAANEQNDELDNRPEQSQPSYSKRYSSVIERSLTSSHLPQENPRTPFITRFDQRRQSFGLGSHLTSLTDGRHETFQKSPAESSDPKHSLPDTASADSQTAASTVWDELDDLKSRIKKLEMTGKEPPQPNNADNGDRPRTATTAPTTIDSSPKQIKSFAETPNSSAGVPQNLADVHPLLQAALAKSKPVISPQLYRVLDATASDALQLAAMTSGVNHQRNTSSAASASERQIKRKADSMCRNLTDLCLALCETREEPVSLNSHSLHPSPSLHGSPPRRFARASFGVTDAITPNQSYRPLSRLEARRSSILGIAPDRDISLGHRSSTENIVQPESIAHRHPRPSPSTQHIPRAGSLLRGQRRDLIHRDEDSTMRPVSRAMTEYGSFRARDSGVNDLQSTSNHISPRYKDALAFRRAQLDQASRPLARASSLEFQAARAQPDEGLTSPVEENEGRRFAFDRSRRQASISGTEFFSRLSKRVNVPARSNSISHRGSMILD